MSCIMLGDTDRVNITEVCLPPNTLRSDDYIIEVILESTGKTEKTNNIKNVKSIADVNVTK